VLSVLAGNHSGNETRPVWRFLGDRPQDAATIAANTNSRKGRGKKRGFELRWVL